MRHRKVSPSPSLQLTKQPPVEFTRCFLFTTASACPVCMNGICVFLRRRDGEITPDYKHCHLMSFLTKPHGSNSTFCLHVSSYGLMCNSVSCQLMIAVPLFKKKEEGINSTECRGGNRKSTSDISSSKPSTTTAFPTSNSEGLFF